MDGIAEPSSSALTSASQSSPYNSVVRGRRPPTGYDDPNDTSCGHDNAGCDHLKAQMHSSRAHCKKFCERYHTLQNYIRKMPRHALQELRSREPSTKPSEIIMTSTLLCIQCFRVCADTEDENERDSVCAHFRKTGHVFFIQSRNGYFFCRKCDDFIFDPKLEKVRLRKTLRQMRQPARQARQIQAFQQPQQIQQIQQIQQTQQTQQIQQIQQIQQTQQTQQSQQPQQIQQTQQQEQEQDQSQQQLEPLDHSLYD